MATISRISGANKKGRISQKPSHGGGRPDIMGSVATARRVFYEQAAGKTNNPIGKKMFLSIVEDEKRTIETFRRMPEMRYINGRDETHSIKKIRTFFEKTGDSLLKRIKATTDEVEALCIAMEMEKESIELCRRLYQEKMRNSKERAVLERLLKEERQRYALFSNTCLFLDEASSWFMWDEHSIADGGTQWA